MNIFYLDTNPEICATYHCDKHVVKMCIEYAQILSTAHRVLDGKLYIDSSSGRKIKRYKLENDELYKATHINHPSSIWARESKENYMYLYNLYKELLKEYTYRYNKIHGSSKLLNQLSTVPKNISSISMTKVPQAMPEYLRESDSVQAYRNYYIKEKKNILSYKNREFPHFINK